MATTSNDEKELDPYSCLALKGKKYAAETTEVYLSNLGGTCLSESFSHFITLEVLWLNNNRLTSLMNLEPCFRIKEMYVTNNRLVSLNFLKSFKFLRVLLASDNCIKNLDKQLQFLSKMSYLRKCDLFGNSIADEPDYRLRMIYHAPQVELLDRLGVTPQQRQTAEEVVPNMDKVAPAKPVKAPKKAFTFTQMESDCFRTAKAIREDRVRVEEESLKKQTFSKGISAESPVPMCRTFLENRHKWSSPSRVVEHELHNATPWEKLWDNGNHKSMQAQILELAGKDELNKDDVLKLTRQLHEDGLEDFGRALSRADVFTPQMLSSSQSLPTLRTPNRRDPAEGVTSKSKAFPLEALNQDPDATMPAKEVASFLLTLEWTRLSDEALERLVGAYNDQGRRACMRATFGASDVKYAQDGDDHLFFKARDKVSRLEGLKTRKAEVGLKPKPYAGVLRKTRSDIFSQSFLKATRSIDEVSGRTMIQVNKGALSTKICG